MIIRVSDNFVVLVFLKYLGFDCQYFQVLEPIPLLFDYQ